MAGKGKGGGRRVRQDAHAQGEKQAPGKGQAKNAMLATAAVRLARVERYLAQQARREVAEKALLDGLLELARVREGFDEYGLDLETGTLTDRSGGVPMTSAEHELVVVALFVERLRRERARSARREAARQRRARLQLVIGGGQ